ncbi:MAG: bifunctional chorismate mutase/prephenate dehydrogenase [Pseudomonadota bacterium]|nr:bifunctional chorismate mutase/prephenate dehydrogenase [Pseudomonadota bacterium]
MSLIDLRNQLDSLDQQLLDLIGERQRTIAQIGEIKRSMGKPLRDFRREKEVLDLAEANAAARGLDRGLAHELMKLLIQHSLTTQENEQLRAEARGDGRRALVIGGSGQMGRWFTRFLDSQGFLVDIVDPAAVDPNAATIAPYGPDGFAQRAFLGDGAFDHDLVLVAAGITASNTVMIELASLRPPGVVIDVASIKAPLTEGYAALRAAGVATASMHPMFGPGAVLLADRHVVVIDLGHPRATAMARQLFAATTAQVVEMSLGEHDRLMAEVLGLSHAVNIVFAAALADGGQDEGRLDRISSATFNAQTRVTRAVVNENPHLYYEIQSLNPNSPEVLERLASALDRLRAALANGDRAAFAELMRRGRGQLGAV